MTEREFFIQKWAEELPLTLGVFNALPSDKLDYRPHEKSRPARSIVGHLLGHAEDLVELAGASGKINHRNELSFSDAADAAAKFKASSTRLESLLPGLDEETWSKTNTKFDVDGHTHFEAPLGYTAWLLLLDTVHHRGQLSTYIRPMGGKHPDIYGPSGDSEESH